jgi:hypothetical protein
MALSWLMSMPRKRKTAALLTFPKPPVEEIQTITCQIGSERFALHFTVEDLPPARPAIPIKRERSK